MKTPICDFVKGYAAAAPLRLHMPGHKGHPLLGPEPLDITEVRGADSLYEASGIIRQSEENAGTLFGCPTYYSTEGASLAIRAMVYLACLWARRQGGNPKILAGRNAHRVFLSAAALLDVEVAWLYGQGQSYLSCCPEAGELEDQILQQKPTAVYLTSPDYLGNLADLRALSRICRKHGVLLLVDGAHGAYLRFLEQPLHPVDLGADLCCTSAHKTLPVLTGGAYLHLNPDLPDFFIGQAKNALAMFGSTSPSYLILQSLDRANPLLADAYPKELQEFVPKVEAVKQQLRDSGWLLYGQEPLKLTLAAKARGYTGRELDRLLEERGIVCEFSDPDFLVVMLAPQIGQDGLNRLKQALLEIPVRKPLEQQPPEFQKAEQVMSIRQAALAPSSWICREECLGRVLAGPSVGCPPAVPILVCGERIRESSLEAFRYYGIDGCLVVDERK